MLLFLHVLLQRKFSQTYFANHTCLRLLLYCEGCVLSPAYGTEPASGLAGCRSAESGTGGQDLTGIASGRLRRVPKPVLWDPKKHHSTSRSCKHLPLPEPCTRASPGALRAAGGTGSPPKAPGPGSGQKPHPGKLRLDPDLQTPPLPVAAPAPR